MHPRPATHTQGAREDSSDDSFDTADAGNEPATQGESELEGPAKKKGAKRARGEEDEGAAADNPLGRFVARWSAKEVEAVETWYLRLGRRPHAIMRKVCAAAVGLSEGCCGRPWRWPECWL